VKVLRVFVSSPGDVGRERVLTGHVLDRLQGEFSRRVELEPYFWEHEPMRATMDFQGNIPKPSTFDIVICILWSRLGSPLNEKYRRADGSPYESGTEYEFEDANEARQLLGKPELLVYRNRQQPMIPIEPEAERNEKIRQFDALQIFLKRWFMNPDGTIRIASNNYQDLGSFEEKLESNLRDLIEQLAPPLEGQQIVAGRPRSYAKGSPFRQLRVFEFEDADIFFGRTQAIDDVLNALRDQAAAGAAFTLIFGNSGSGKSSLARAGVLPLLVRPGVIEGIGLWRWAIMRPSEFPGDIFTGLATALMNADALHELSADDGVTVAELAKTLREAPSGVPLFIKRSLAQAARNVQGKEGLTRPPAARLVILIDQLEEIFTLADRFSTETRSRFVSALAELARSGVVWVVATLRSEFFGRCEEIPELVTLKSGKGQYQLLPPTKSELRQIVRFPALAAGLQFEVDPDGGRLDDVLVDAAGRNPGSLALLEFALEELYKRRRDDCWLTHAALVELKGIEGALDTTAEGVFNTLPADAAAQFEPVFRSLATIGLGEKAAFVRRIADLDTLASTPERRRLIDSFVDGRLLVTGSDTENRPIVQVAHEALFLFWPRLTKLLEGNREFLHRRARVAAASGDWQAQKRDGSYLWWHGRPLAEAKDLLARPDDLTPDEKEFAEESVRAGAAARRKHWLAMAAVLLVAGAAGWAGYLWLEKSRADAEVDRLRNELHTAPDSEPYLILRLSRELLRKSGDPETWPRYAKALLETNDLPAFDAAMEKWKQDVSPLPAKAEDLLGDRDAKQQRTASAIEHWKAYLRNRDVDAGSRNATWQKMAEAAIALGDWEQAENYLTYWISAADNNPARIQRAKVYRELRYWMRALDDVDNARGRNPRDAGLKEFPATDRPRYEKVVELDALISRSQRDPKLWRARATELTRLHRFQAALEDIEKARSFDSDSIRLMLDQAHLLWQLKRPIPDELAVRPDDAWTSDEARFSAAFEAMQKELDGLGELDTKLQAAPDQAELHLERSALLNRLHQPALAEKDSQRARELQAHPNPPP
jgi:tetratricopeptide (TPR) repeat protein